jgi:hypothetical protein
MSPRALAPAFLALALTLLAPSPAPAFNVETRTALLLDAIEFCPQDLRAYLRDNKDTIKSGLHFSDMSETPLDPMKIPEIQQHIVDRIKAGRLTEYETLNLYGVLACHLAETVYPGHQNSSQNTAPDIVRYDGFHEITDPRAKVNALIHAYKIYHGKNDFEMVQSMYCETVNLIADFWMTAWKAGGKDIEKGSLMFGEEIARKRAPKEKLPKKALPVTAQ